MLLKYRADYEKVAMGLLSFVPTLKKIDRLQAELQWYQDSDARQLLLWKDMNQDFSGIVGVEIRPKFVIVRLIALTPAVRDENQTNTILDELQDMYPDQRIMGTLENTAVIARWEARHE
ncbi:N-acetyltransferase [Secundilactobacillus folii]|uniref:N-acetyltransferase n=1 Tax=Secundilactobacillus folii TaxID=2678357 RepID=A0A7X3C0Z9_9LACO|nr:N-acetyltransferase [Secundilactobacillus folii]MTV81210.1 N-acetyltransferase [Secundilactobacillus folii]